MTGIKRSHSRQQGQDPRRALALAGARQWRLFSLLMLVLLAAVLLVGPASAKTGSAGAPAKPALNVVVIGDFYSYGYAHSTDPALRRTAPPALQALNQIQAANPGVQINVLFIPVKDAVSGGLYRTSGPGAQSGQPALISAVGNASIVIVGAGVGNARFAEWMRNVLFGTAGSAKKFARSMTVFNDGSYLQAQTALLGDIATRVAASASIVTVGYPRVLPERLSSGLTWWSPYSWSAISQQQANASDQLASALDTANDQATSITAAHHPGMYFLYADLSGALKGTPSAQGSQSNGMRLTIIGNGLLPYLDQAVNNELAAKGVQGAVNVPPITPASRWNLTVQVPVTVRPPHLPQHPTSNSGINSPAAALAGPPLKNAAGTNPPPGITPRLCLVQPATGVIKPTGRVCRGPGCRIVCRPAGSAGGAAGRLARSFGLPAPPAPLPKPLSPQHAPNAGGGRKGSNPGGNSSTNPSQGGGNASQGSTTSPSAGASSGGGTTSSGGGTTSSGSGSSSAGSPSSGGSSFGSSSSYGGSPSSGGWSSGGGSSGGGSAS